MTKCQIKTRLKAFSHNVFIQRFHTTFLFLIITFFLLTMKAESNCELSMQFPTYGMHGISTDVSVSLTSSCPIDTAKLFKSFLDFEFLQWDSVSNELNFTVAYFIESGIYTGTDSSFIEAILYHSVPGVFEPRNSMLTMVKPLRPLLNGTQYDIFIGYLTAQFGIGYVTFDTTITNAFTTIEEMYHVKNYSIYEKYPLLNCSDSIYVTMNRKVNSATINNQDILTLKQITGYNFIDSLHHTMVTTGIDTRCLLSQDSLSILLDVEELDAGIYILEIHLNELTGDPNDYMEEEFRVGNLAIITTSVMLEDTSAIIPEDLRTFIGDEELYIGVGHDVLLETNLYNDNLQFKRWSCESLPQIHNSTEYSTILNVECSMVGHHNIIAVYGDILIDTLVLHQDLFNGGNVRVEGYRDSLGNGTYTFERKVDYDIAVWTDNPNNNNVFDGWTYDAEYEDFEGWKKEGNIITFGVSAATYGLFSAYDIFDLIGRKIELGGGWTPCQIVQCDEFIYCFDFYGAKGTNINNIVTVYINGIPTQLDVQANGGGQTSGRACITVREPFPDDVELEFEITDPCYIVKLNQNGTKQIRSQTRSKNIENDFTQVGNNYLANLTRHNADDNFICEDYISITFDKKRVGLQVDYALIGDSFFTNAAGPINVRVYNQTKNSMLYPYFTLIKKDDERPPLSSNVYRVNNYYWDCDCGDELDIFPVINDAGYELGFWQTPTLEDTDLVTETFYEIKYVFGQDRDHVLSVVAESDIHAFYRFNTGFKLNGFSYRVPRKIVDNEIGNDSYEKFILRENIRIGAEEKLYEQVVAMDLDGLGVYEHFPTHTPYTTEVGFHFSKPLDMTTVNPNTFYAIDASPSRRDGKNNTSYYFGENLSEPKNWRTVNDQIVYLKLSDTRSPANIMDIPHMNMFNVSIDLASIRSIDDDRINFNVNDPRRIDVLMETEYPAFNIGTHKIYMDKENTNHWTPPGLSFMPIDLFSHIWCSIGFNTHLLFPQSEFKTQAGLQYPATNQSYTFLLYKAAGNYTIWDNPRFMLYIYRMQPIDQFAAGYDLTRRFDGAAYNKFGNITEFIVGKILEVWAPEWKLGQFLLTAVNKFQDLSWCCWQKKDEVLVNPQFAKPKARSELWGAEQLYKPKYIPLSQTISNGKITITTELEVYLIGE